METREELEKLEGARKGIRLKARHCKTTFICLLHYQGTVTPRILTSALSWASIAVYIAWKSVCVLVFINPDNPAAFTPYITLSELSPLISFVVFLFVFINTSIFSQFYDQYNLSMSLEGRVFDICIMARSFLPMEYSIRIWRRINAAHCLGYVGLTQGKIYSRDNFLDSFLEEHQLLTPDELARINEIDPTCGGSAFREVLAWIADDIKDYIESLSDCKDHARILSETSIARDLIQQILTFRGKMGSIYDYADMPMPLIYRHLVLMIAWVFLPIYCFTVAENGRFDSTSVMYDLAVSEVLSALLVILMIFFVVGTRLVGDALADPYGNYLEDLSILQYNTFTVVASRKILMASKFDKTSLDEELELESRRPHLGSAWYGFKEVNEDKAEDPYVGIVRTAASMDPLPESPRPSSNRPSRVTFQETAINGSARNSRNSVRLSAQCGIHQMDHSRSMRILELAAEGLE